MTAHDGDGTDDADDQVDALPAGEVPAGVGPEVFRERLERAATQDPEDGAVVVLEGEELFLADIESVEAEDDGGRSRVRLRNGLIIGGVTGAAIVGALAAVRYHRRRRGDG
jgi:hypothetical protein